MKRLMIFFMLTFACNAAFAKFDTLFVITSNDTAVIWHKHAFGSCVSKFVFDVTVGNDTIIIVERDTVGTLVDCNCWFDLNVTMVNLIGNYIAMVYCQELKIYNHPKDTSYLIGSVSFSIPNISVLPYFSIVGFQSECGGVPVSVEKRQTSMPQITRIINHPNPFNSVTNFQFTLPADQVGISNFQFVSLKIYDALGKEIATIVNGEMEPGEHIMRWNAVNFSSGIYFYRLAIGNQMYFGKMNLVK